MRRDYASLDEFLRRCTSAERKVAILQEMQEHGVLLEPLVEEVGKDYAPFDLICYVAFEQPPLTRTERANLVMKHNYFTRYGEQARRVLESLLE